jgi:hypothetical protein
MKKLYFLTALLSVTSGTLFSTQEEDRIIDPSHPTTHAGFINRLNHKLDIEPDYAEARETLYDWADFISTELTQMRDVQAAQTYLPHVIAYNARIQDNSPRTRLYLHLNARVGRLATQIDQITAASQNNNN